MVPDTQHLLDQLLEAMVKTEQVALEGFRSRSYELKADQSIVTDTDRLVEQLLRAELSRITPDYGVWGEEFGLDENGGDALWLIDPIDGTSNFAFGLPFWGTTVGLYRGGSIELGAIFLPVLGERIWAGRGQGAHRNGSPLPALRPGPIQEQELVGHGSLSAARDPRFPGKMRHFGSFVVEAWGVATQSLRAMTTSRASLYDAAGGIAIFRELGAEMVHLDGSPFHEKDWLKPGIMKPAAILPPGHGIQF